MADPIQKVFEDISLQKNLKLWMSTDDGRLRERLNFLSKYPETKFENVFNAEFENSKKNEKLSEAFFQKAKTLNNPNQGLMCLNKAMLFATQGQKAKIVSSAYLSSAIPQCWLI